MNLLKFSPPNQLKLGIVSPVFLRGWYFYTKVCSKKQSDKLNISDLHTHTIQEQSTSGWDKETVAMHTEIRNHTMETKKENWMKTATETMNSLLGSKDNGIVEIEHVWASDIYSGTNKNPENTSPQQEEQTRVPCTPECQAKETRFQNCKESRQLMTLSGPRLPQVLMRGASTSRHRKGHALCTHRRLRLWRQPSNSQEAHIQRSSCKVIGVYTGQDGIPGSVSMLGCWCVYKLRQRVEECDTGGSITWHKHNPAWIVRVPHPEGSPRVRGCAWEPTFGNMGTRQHLQSVRDGRRERWYGHSTRNTRMFVGRRRLLLQDRSSKRPRGKCQWCVPWTRAREALTLQYFSFMPAWKNSECKTK